MTKMKSKKMTKSTFAIIIMAIAIVALLAFGGSYAYFTATTTAKSGGFTTGTIKLTSDDQVKIVTAGTKIVPGQSIVAGDEKTIQFTPDSDVKTIVYVVYSVEAKKGENDYTFKNASKADVAQPITVSGESAFAPLTGETGVFYKVVDAGAKTPLLFSEDLVFSTEIAANSHEDTVADSMGVTVTVTLYANAIQYDGLTGDDDAEKAAAGWTIVESLKAEKLN